MSQKSAGTPRSVTMNVACSLLLRFPNSRHGDSRCDKTPQRPPKSHGMAGTLRLSGLHRGLCKTYENIHESMRENYAKTARKLRENCAKTTQTCVNTYRGNLRENYAKACANTARILRESCAKTCAKTCAKSRAKARAKARSKNMRENMREKMRENMRENTRETMRELMRENYAKTARTRACVHIFSSRRCAKTARKLREKLFPKAFSKAWQHDFALPLLFSSWHSWSQGAAKLLDASSQLLSLPKSTAAESSHLPGLYI